MVGGGIEVADEVAERGGLAATRFGGEQRAGIAVERKAHALDGILEAGMGQQRGLVDGLRERGAVQLEVIFDETHDFPFRRRPRTWARSASRYCEAWRPEPSVATAVRSAVSAIAISTGAIACNTVAACSASTSPSARPQQVRRRSTRRARVNAASSSGA